MYNVNRSILKEGVYIMKHSLFRRRALKLFSVALTVVIFMSLLPGVFAGASSSFDNVDENELYTKIKDNGNGTKELTVYGVPVKYADASGKIRETSLEIEEKTGGSYGVKEHPVNVVFPSVLGDGIRLSYENLDITVLPEGGSETLSRAEFKPLKDSGKIIYPADAKTSYEYSLTYTGFKEDIVVNEYTGRDSYRFIIKTGGKAVRPDGDSAVITDRSGRVLAILGDVVIRTADGREEYGKTVVRELKKNREYEVEIKIDPAFLSDPGTVYPLIIDPSVEVNYTSSGSGAIEDVTIYSATSSVGTSGSLFTGLHASYGKSRTLMRFPSLPATLASLQIDPGCVLLSYVELRDVICDTNAMTVFCHEYNKTSPAWTESGNPSWTDVGNSYLGEMSDSCSVSYGNGTATGSGAAHWYRFNITDLSKRWITGASDPSKGIVFKASDSFENQTGSGTVYLRKTFASYNNTSYRPTLTIIYSDRYKASSADIQFYNNNYNTGNSLQFRCNCYGYAIRAFYYPEDFNHDYFEYKQQPGEFAPDRLDMGSFDDLIDYYKLIDSWSNYLSCVMGLIEMDFAEFGISISGASKYTSASQIPSASDYSDRRLILLVTGRKQYSNGSSSPYKDFHFYVQNGDDTWSHKMGTLAAQNSCVGTCSNPVTSLTNSNILDHLGESYEVDNDYLFFWIKMPANIENIRNGYGHDGFCTNTPYVFGDEGGSVVSSSGYKAIDISTVAGKIDYIGDIDIFSVTRSMSGLVTFSVTTGNGGFPITVEVMDQSGVTLGSVQATTGSGSFNVSLTRGNLYYLKIIAIGQTLYSEQKSYVVIIS